MGLDEFLKLDEKMALAAVEAVVMENSSESYDAQVEAWRRETLKGLRASAGGAADA